MQLFASFLVPLFLFISAIAGANTTITGSITGKAQVSSGDVSYKTALGNHSGGTSKSLLAVFHGGIVAFNAASISEIVSLPVGSKYTAQSNSSLGTYTAAQNSLKGPALTTISCTNDSMGGKIIYWTVSNGSDVAIGSNGVTACQGEYYAQGVDASTVLQSCGPSGPGSLSTGNYSYDNSYPGQVPSIAFRLYDGNGNHWDSTVETCP